MIMFLVSLFIASFPWLFLDSEKHRISAFINKHYSIEQYIQDFDKDYYLWFFAIFIGFSTIIFTTIKKSLKKYYWISLTIVVMAFGSIFLINYHDSQPYYDFSKGIKNLDYTQFKSGLDKGVKSSWEKGVAHSLISKYNTGNAYDVKRMVKLFINHTGLVTFLDDKDLKSAVETNDAELVEILLSSKHAKLADDVDFVVDKKSTLKLAIEQNNPEIVELLLKAGARPAKDEKLFDAPRSEKLIQILKNCYLEGDAFYYLDTFENGSEKFRESSDSYGEWSNINGEYKCYSKTDSHFIKKTSDFNIDVAKEYTVEVKTRITFAGMGYGIVFDDNGISYHILVFDETMLMVYKYDQNQWTKEYNVPISVKYNTNKLKLVKKGNYITCYFNGSRVLKNKYIKNFRGNKLGMIISSSKKNGRVQFDDFKVIGTRKKITL